ncbi:MAG: 7-carboxy-7-deazaguanine synthase QueE [Gammaproteobacteria bacterium]|nr:7-carboxy-7-deazaguanine synthase QueE [Gammaproteobacteria bacterium]
MAEQPVDNKGRLRITEIFYSLQGETSLSGLPTVFIRLTGCPLRCHYCDTEYAFSGGQWMLLDEILAQLEHYNTRYVTVTGGEPLAQKASLELMQRLCDQGYQVSLETSGSLSIAAVDDRVSRIVDIKTPGSGEDSKNDYANIDELQTNDQLKFVITKRADYDWAKEIMKQYALDTRCEVLFSPVADQISATDLADWILQDQLPVRFQLQLHRILWGDTAGK